MLRYGPCSGRSLLARMPTIRPRAMSAKDELYLDLFGAD